MSPVRTKTGAGWKRYVIKYNSAVSATRELYGFERAFGIQIALGAQYVDGLLLYHDAGRDRIDRYELRDGKTIPTPGGVSRIEVELKTDVPSDLCRVVLYVLTLPNVTWSATEGYDCYASRVTYPSTLHYDPGGATIVLGLAGLSKVCDVFPPYQELDQVSENALGNAIYGGRFQGDEGSPAWPTAGLYFDGFISTNFLAAGADFKVWILAYMIQNGSLPELAVYRELTTPKDFSAAAALFPANPPVTGVLTKILADLSPSAASPVALSPIPVPANGFQVWVENTGTQLLQLRGVIGARSA